MRLFIAVEPPRELRERAFALAAPLRAASKDVHWSTTEQMHFTIKFLGEVEDARVPELVERLRAAFAGWKAFPVRVQGAGWFGNERFLRVLWFGAREGREELLAMMERADAEFEDVRVEEHEHTAHLTVGRVVGGGGRERLIAAVREMEDAEVGEFLVTEVLLKKSVPGKVAAGSAGGSAHGPVYETVGRVGFG